VNVLFDYMINNVLIADGRGSRSLFRANVAVNGIKFGPIGGTDFPANRTIEGNGLILAPGFIDLHGHSDALFLLNELQESKVFQGVTTEVCGQCGLSLVPNDPLNLEKHIDGISFAFDHLDKIDWVKLNRFEDYLNAIDARSISMNCAPLVGHGAIRTVTMGFDNRPPSKKELQEMVNFLDDSLTSGAWGMSLGLLYPPGAFARIEELETLAEVVASHSAIIHVHLRNENETIFESIKEIIEIGKQSGAHIHISHLKLTGKSQWGKGQSIVDLIRGAREAGINIDADQYPYEASSTGLMSLVPKWSFEGGINRMLDRLRGKVIRKEIEEEIEKNILVKMIGSQSIMLNTRGIIPEYDFRFVSDISSEKNLTPGEIIVDILLATKGQARANFFAMDKSDILFFMSQEDIGVGSDGRAYAFKQEITPGSAVHPRSFGTFPKFLRMVLDNNLMSVEQAIRKITGYAAEIMGIPDRGLVSEGFIADFVLFDPERVRDRATYEKPCLKPEGIPFVFVNGKPVVFNDLQTKERPGGALRRSYNKHVL